MIDDTELILEPDELYLIRQAIETLEETEAELWEMPDNHVILEGDEHGNGYLDAALARTLVDFQIRELLGKLAQLEGASDV